MALTSDQQDGVAYLSDLLTSYGLQSLTGWAKDQVIAGNSPAMISQMLQDTPEFKSRFKVIFDRRDKGLAPMSVSDVINYEHAARQTMQAAGLPPGFYDSSADFYNFMVNDVSMTELTSRVDLAKTIVYSTDPTTRAQMKSLFGMNDGQEIAFMLDPNRALPLIQQQVLAAQDSAAGVRAGYGGLSAQEALSLAQQNISQSQAQTGFGNLVSNQQLFNPLPGQEGAESTITRQQQLNATFNGDAVAAQKIKTAGEQRVAAFQGGGAYTASQQGIAGLGSSAT